MQKVEHCAPAGSRRNPDLLGRTLISLPYPCGGSLAVRQQGSLSRESEHKALGEEDGKAGRRGRRSRSNTVDVTTWGSSELGKPGGKVSEYFAWPG